jgi:hypothetical protein
MRRRPSGEKRRMRKEKARLCGRNGGNEELRRQEAGWRPSGEKRS